MSSPFADVPAAVRALVPEAGEPWPDEPRAACGACPMAASTAPHPWSFAADLRCCGFHPTLANYDVGRALAGDPRGAALVRARLRDRAGVSALGIGPSPSETQRYRARGLAAFGRAGEQRCPFWAGGEHACGIWAARPATCRTWFCKHERGLAGAMTWRELGALVGEAEAQVAALLCARGAPPADDGTEVDVDAWLAWFAWCAAEVERLDDAALAPLMTPATIARRATLRARRDRGAPAMADVLVPSVQEWLRHDDRVLITGYSSYDAVAAPPAVFAVLARLDGRTAWRDALAAARAETGDAALDVALVAELHRVGAVRNADEAEVVDGAAR